MSSKPHTDKIYKEKRVLKTPPKFEIILEENQKEVVEFVKKHQITLLIADPGCGKAQPLDSKVVTSNGYKLMGDLIVGDKIITENGDETTILGIYPQGSKKIVKITLNDGSTTECCEEHLWSVIKKKNLYNQFHKKNGKEYINSNYLKYETLSTNEIISKLSNNYYLPKHKPVDFSKSTYFKENHNIDPYLMGVLLGDGGLTQNSVILSTIDKEILNSVDEIIKDHNCSLKKKDIKSCDYRINGVKQKNEILNEIRRLNINVGSKEKFIPKEYIFTNIDNRFKLLNGLLDTDGTVEKNQRISISTSSLQLANDILFLIFSLGGVGKIKHREGKYKNNNGDIIKTSINYNVYLYFEDYDKLFTLTRKRDRLLNNKRNEFKRIIKKIEYIGEKECQCIYVESPSHLYLTDNFIVTHNTTIALFHALTELRKRNIEKIILTKPIVEVGRSIGFLPGSADEKVAHYLRSFIDNIEKIVGKLETEKLFREEKIIFEPIQFCRGVTFENACIIADEIQGASLHEQISFITRKSDTAQLILMADPFQMDVKNSGIFDLIEILKDHDDVGIMELDETYQKRSKLIQDIYKKYKTHITK
jgi:phosphate starvation-inducible protein PhoH